MEIKLKQVMAQYIDKEAVVAEIESKFQKYWKKGEESDSLQDGNAKYWGGVLSCLNEVKTLINTFEVKEVNLKEEIQSWVEDNSVNGYYREDVYETAEHFFELGLQAQKGE